MPLLLLLLLLLLVLLLRLLVLLLPLLLRLLLLLRLWLALLLLLLLPPLLVLLLPLLLLLLVLLRRCRQDSVLAIVNTENKNPVPEANPMLLQVPDVPRCTDLSPAPLLLQKSCESVRSAFKRSFFLM